MPGQVKRSVSHRNLISYWKYYVLHEQMILNGHACVLRIFFSQTQDIDLLLKRAKACMSLYSSFFQCCCSVGCMRVEDRSTCDGRDSGVSAGDGEEMGTASSSPSPTPTTSCSSAWLGLQKSKQILTTSTPSEKSHLPEIEVKYKMYLWCYRTSKLSLKWTLAFRHERDCPGFKT